MSGTLFVVATPIGNLEDITLRALRVLREVNVIAAEDTRRTARLLSHHGIATPSVSFHQHNVRTRIPQLLRRLGDGLDLALVTDAGTPGISDPGAELVAACAEAGIPIDPVPGVSAALATAVVSGFPLVPLTIFGFPPRRSKDRSGWFATVAGTPHTVTFFESPLRIAATLRQACAYLGNRQIIVGREVTKHFQEFVRGSCAEAAEKLSNAKGEITVVLGPTQQVGVSVDLSAADRAGAAAQLFKSLSAESGFSRRAAISETARRLGVSAREVYAAVERAKNSGV